MRLFLFGKLKNKYKKKTDMHVQEERQDEQKKQKIFLNYNTECDEAYVKPLELICNQEGVLFMKNEYQRIGECSVLINVVKSLPQKDLLLPANQYGIRIINLIFDQETYGHNESMFSGECFEIENKQINQYLMYSLLQSDVKKVEVIESIRRIIRGEFITSSIHIKDDNTTILFFGSFGYSSLRTILMTPTYKLNCKTYLIAKNESSTIGQPGIGVNTWCLDVDQFDIENLENEIKKWLIDNVSTKKLVFVGGLGKKTASVLLPLFTAEAINLGIICSAVCIMPLEFESNSIKQRAVSSLHILNSMCKPVVIQSDSNVKNISFQEFHRIQCNSVMQGIERLVNMDMD